MIRERRERFRERQLRIEALRQRQDAEDQASLAAAVDAEPALAVAGAVVVPIPTGPGELVPLPAEVRATYLAHLQTIAIEAVDAGPDPDAEEEDAEAEGPPVDPVTQDRCDQLCGLCRGGCCAQGGDEAYLSVETLRRQLAAAPTDAAGLVERYRDHLPERHMQGSCVNHTEVGCALPRELRSRICNRYFCGGLEGYRKTAGVGAAPPVVAVRRAHSAWDRFEPHADHRVVAVTVIDGDGPRPAPVAPKPAA